MEQEEKTDLSKGLDNILYSVRVNQRVGYKVNKWIFNISTLLLLILLVLMITTNTALIFDGQRTLINPYNEPALNPLYDHYLDKPSCEWWYCSIKVLPPYFNNNIKTSWYFNNGFIIALIIFLLPYIINHKLYNKNKSFWVKK